MSLKQMSNGKAFEYAIGKAVVDAASGSSNVEFVEDDEFRKCRKCFDEQCAEDRDRFSKAAVLPLDTLFRLEPAIGHPTGATDILFVKFNADAAGIAGDVRDVLLFRKDARGGVAWEIGISAKNNHDAVKHSRISPSIDFGREWLGLPCSSKYKTAVANVFAQVQRWKSGGASSWRELGESKEKDVYAPLLKAFMDEMIRLFAQDQRNAAESLIKYLIGREPFYKVVKQDHNAMVVMKAFNFVPGLGLSYNGVRPDCRPDVIPLPSRMVELAESDRGTGSNALTLIMNHGWQVDFRIHNANSKLENSLKFDIQLVGNPPGLFTQHIF